MGVGRGAWTPWILKISANKGCLLDFEWENPNFIIFVPLWKNFGKIQEYHPWKKSFRRACLQVNSVEHVRYREVFYAGIICARGEATCASMLRYLREKQMFLISVWKFGT